MATNHETDIPTIIKNMEKMGWPVRQARGNSVVVTLPAGGSLRLPTRQPDRSPTALNNNLRQIREAGYYTAWEAYETARRPAKRTTRRPDAETVPMAAEPAPGGMVTVSALVTPVMAARWLELPPARLDDGTEIQQRTLDGGWVDEIAGWIDTGDWRESYEGFAFTGPGIDDPGSMLDGQHRCWAIVQAGATVPARLTFNAPAPLFQITNQGKRRNNANILQTLGDANSKDLASALRMIWEYERSLAGDRRFAGRHWSGWPGIKMSAPALVQVREVHSDPDKGLPISESMFMSAVMRRLQGVAAAGIAWHHLAARSWEGEPERLATFVDHLRSGAMLGERHPALTLRNWISAQSSKRQLDKRERMFLALTKAWTAYVEGSDLGRIYIGEREEMWPLPVRPKARRRAYAVSRDQTDGPAAG